MTRSGEAVYWCDGKHPVTFEGRFYLELPERLGDHVRYTKGNMA